jgi:hypothetical protein
VVCVHCCSTTCLLLCVCVCITAAGYAYMTGGRMMGRNAGQDSQPVDMQALEKVGASFLGGGAG